MILDIKQANNILLSYVPSAGHITSRNVTVERMQPLLELVGNPHTRLKVIHVAGTSGKTSTSYYIASLLNQMGFKVGLTISPHIDSVTERVQINVKPISEQLFCQYLTEFLDLIGNSRPTYFEMTVALALYIFDKIKVDYAIIETGIGGLYDSTNVCRNPDKVCVITDIGYDHMNILGNTLKEIASQKAGIIHHGNQVLMYQQDEEIMNSIKDRVKKYSANLQTFKQPKLQTKYPGVNSELALFQKRNWLLAREVVEHLIIRDTLQEPNFQNELNSQKVLVPGRMDIVQNKNSILIYDGAHNQQKMATFVESFKAKFPNQKADILLALKQDKDFTKVLNELIPITNNIILTSFGTTQDIPVRSIDPNIIAEYLVELGFNDFSVINNIEEAIKMLLKSESKIKLITGSFYLIGQVRTLNKTQI